MEGQEAVALDRFGTRTYGWLVRDGLICGLANVAAGAPETYADSSSTEQRRNKIKRSIDIWSLGAIYSEASVWTVKGGEGVDEYRKRRRKATGRMPNFRIADCFHDGQRRLDVVDEQHEELRPGQIRSDTQDTQDALVGTVTSFILDTMVEEMMHEVPAQRPNSQQLDGKAEKALKRARDLVSSYTPGSRQSVPSTPPTPDTSVPSQHERVDSGSGSVAPFFYEPGRYVASPRPTIHMPDDSDYTASPYATGSPQGERGPHRTRTTSGGHAVHGNTAALMRAMSTASAHQNNVRGIPEGSRASVALSGTGSDAHLSGAHIRHVAGYPEGNAQIPSTAQVLNDVGKRLGKQRLDDLDDPFNDGLVICPCCDKRMEEAIVDLHIETECQGKGTETDSALSNQSSGPASSPSTTRLGQSPKEAHHASTRKVPSLSVLQTRSWYDRKKGTDKYAELPDHWLLENLKGRDHVSEIWT